jgi:5-formyltetrahydrofolate cyclo-ligase
MHLFRSSSRIACYLAVDGELDTLPLLQRACRLGKEIYLPILPARASDRLKFARYRPGDRLVNNRFGIPEPMAGTRRILAPAKLDLVMAPLVAFDADGNRLGMGGGYYDRTFAYLHQRTRWVKPRMIGIAYDFQRQAHLPAQPWDVPLHAIATETRLYLPTRR